MEDALEIGVDDMISIPIILIDNGFYISHNSWSWLAEEPQQTASY
jgi:hypothetical protein